MSSEIVIPIEPICCCICLESKSNNTLSLNCCKNQVHRDCFLTFFLHRIANENEDNLNCFLCRAPLDISKIISSKDLKKQIKDEKVSRYIICKYYLKNMDKFTAKTRRERLIEKATIGLCIFVAAIFITWIALSIKSQVNGQT